MGLKEIPDVVAVPATNEEWFRWAVDSIQELKQRVEELETEVENLRDQLLP